MTKHEIEIQVARLEGELAALRRVLATMTEDAKREASTLTVAELARRIDEVRREPRPYRVIPMTIEPIVIPPSTSPWPAPWRLEVTC